MRTPGLYETRIALETYLFSVLKSAFQEGSLVIVQPGEDIKPDLNKIQVIHSVNPGNTLEGELGGRNGIVPRVGVYVITLSSPNDSKKFAEAQKIASNIERAFYRVDLPVEGTDCTVMCNQSIMNNVGETSDKRLVLSISVDWWVWAGGY